MGIVTGIASVIFIVWLVRTLFTNKASQPRNRQNTRRESSGRAEQTHTARQHPTPPARSNPTTFRPSTTARRSSSIQFTDSSTASTPSEASKPPKEFDFRGLHDALTGAALDIGRGLFQCTTCKVFYHNDSIELLRAENSGRCVSCQSTTLVAIARGSKAAAGKDYTPSVVTQADYHKHVGTVVTFEGFVPVVRESARGNDFAVMFENKGWKKSFKLVFFRDAVTAAGGRPYINSLQGKTVRVRGLLKNHATFGYEIIVSEPGMILSVH